ncbi:putative thiosulfate sulfurtransferase [Bradyrhizobium oligotrophicum S58]|uniref:Putative thiosulfate sulfurtransferase n=1 Tax=Bradyrhizobium oligotrophicum S58 TaxID=1245469 RepID=M4ZCY6_9BRAD|nr:rhodanese-like domain-containing protein [Bradyrhizobium oligotrophicum]BAM91693.1 putative thiosulfate sulfurtransferase [Bradyrhizobium oligotrophicum S58]
MTPSPTSGPTAPPPDGVSIITPTELRRRWRAGEEVALFDVREEGPYSLSHPFFAVSLPLSQIELRILDLAPRLTAPIVVYDDGEGYAVRAVPRIRALGYTDVSVLEGGLSGYARQGEVFRDVNVPSKSFGELVEAIRHTPSLSADEAKALIERESNLVVLDARRFEEYRTMSIPRGVSVPGGELAFRARELAPSPDTTIIVNCAGRTRSIIGTQSLINAGLPNKIYALRNGTIGWTLAGHQVERGKTARFLDRPQTSHTAALDDAKAWAGRVGVTLLDAATFARYQAEAGARTLYCLDVRTPEEYLAGHPAGFASAPGGQLVQATDEWVGVRGARLVLFDDDGVRARMTASWLKQMGWDASVVGPDVVTPTQTAVVVPRRPPLPDLGAATISVTELAADPAARTIVDLSRSPGYKAGHIPGAHFLLASRFADDLARLPGSGAVVLTSDDGAEAAFALADARAATRREIRVLSGGTRAWMAAGHALETERHAWISLADDVYKRPYEGTDNAATAMQAYIDWELQLVAQLANDSVSNFHVV